VGEQAVIAHADAQASGNPPEKDGDEESLPGKEKERDDGSDVKQAHESGSDPVNLAIILRFFLQDFERLSHRGL
jgi:hypothetical protein